MFSSNTSQVSNDVNYIEDVFSTYLYTGNGSTQTITNGIDLAGKGGLAWIKIRETNGGEEGHRMYDTVRGAQNSLVSNATNATQTQSNSLSSFNSSGFSFNGAYLGTNGSGYKYASWTFREQPKFYKQELISHTNGTATNIDLSTLGTVGYLHAKITNTTGDWIAWHRSLTAGNNLRLNTTAAQSTTDAWLSISGTTATLSASAPTGSYIVHAFAHDAGGFGLTGTDNVLSCGSIAATGGVNNVVDLGYEPQLVIIKSATVVNDWHIIDNMRGFTANNGVAHLFPNSSTTESTTTVQDVGLTATGFTIDPNLNGFNGTGTYIYIAIRRGPMKVPTDATKVFSPIAANNSTGTINTTGFPVDLQISTARADIDNRAVDDRLRGVSTTTTESGQLLRANTTDNEVANYITRAWDNTGFQTSSGGYGGLSAIYWNFRRAPGFFDEVCYTSTQANASFNHNLSVAPELMLIKCRSNAFGWYVYSTALGNSSYLTVNTTDAATAGALWQNTTPTSTQFFLNGSNAVNGTVGQTYVAYLFATCPGVSKVGSYTGNGSTQTINCGFTGGARFVLIKRTDSTGDWYVWDSARGIVAGDDPYLLLNNTAAEVTTTDYVDTFSAGFEISSTAPAAINASGGTFIYLAIA